MLRKFRYKVKKNPDFVRHVYKTVSYRFFALFITFSIGYILTGSIKIGLAFSAIEIVIKSMFYFLHERFWFKYIRFNNKKQ